MTNPNTARQQRPLARVSGSRNCKPRNRRFECRAKGPKRDVPYFPINSGIREIQSIASRIESMPAAELSLRYHELVDLRFEAPLSVTERFELERIEARLDAIDHDPILEERDREWEANRMRLLDSIQDLLERLRG